MLKRAIQQVKGLVISWNDEDPLSTSEKLDAGKVSHKNPVYRAMASQIFRQHGEWILRKQPMRWLINISVVFLYENGIEQNEQREIEGQSTISGLNDLCMDEIEDAFKHGNMDNYVTTRFEIECLGL